MRSLILAAGVVLLLGAPPVQAQGRRVDRAPKVGEVAPDFELARLEDGAPTEELVELSSFKGKKPVVLLFGSCT